MPNASLELVAPVALVAARRRAQYVRSASAGLLASSVSLSVCVGLGYVGALGATLVAGTLVVLCFAAARVRWVQRGLDWQAVQRARARREWSRQRALCQAAAARQVQYTELRGLVEGVERCDPDEAQRLELQELLDRFVQLAVGHQLCLESLRVVSGTRVQSATPPTETPPTRRRRDIAARRVRHGEETAARLERIADEIDSADDLIRLVAQRTACAGLDPFIDREGEIDRRLAELDEVDAALGQVSA